MACEEQRFTRRELVVRASVGFGGLLLLPDVAAVAPLAGTSSEAAALFNITTLVGLENRSRSQIVLENLEHRDARGSGRQVEPGQVLGRDEIEMLVPAAHNSADFPARHLLLRYDGQPRYWIWQADQGDGYHVRYSTNGSWLVRGWPVDGMHEVDGERTLVVMDSGFQLVTFPSDLLDVVRKARERTLVFDDSLSEKLGAIPSVPRTSAVAFSIAGAEAAKHLIYRDFGRRYEFRLERGVAVVRSPGLKPIRLVEAVSYTHRRAGEYLPVPALDMIAASQGRVFAKEQGGDRFFFAELDPSFRHRTESGDIAIPDTYFKRDPEFNRDGRRVADLSAHLDGAFANHPAAERFPLYRALLELEAVDAMVVRFQPRVWQELDARPPLGSSAAVHGLIQYFLDRWPRSNLPLLKELLNAIRDWAESIKPRVEEDRRKAINPPRDPSYPHAVYRSSTNSELQLHAIKYQRVLDIAVGHVHWHEHYQGITGGELQLSRDEPIGYRMWNGPIRDGDGYNDGTCNFYILVELAKATPDALSEYALLYIDEQSYASGRWRYADPADHRGLDFAAVAHASIRAELARQPYWSPFREQLIGPASRLAVAAQVVLVTGGDRPETRSKIYSTNFSWGTIDRGWRWRDLPAEAQIQYFDAEAVKAGNEPVKVNAAHPDVVYPQSIRLREDMTLHLKGTHARPGKPPLAGRWYQRYLPASLRLAPPGSAQRHTWKFLSEPVFRLADQFGQLGVYDAQVSSRSQYYVVEPATAGDEAALAAAEGERWTDPELTLFRWTLRIHYAAPTDIFDPSLFIPGRLNMKPVSLFNRETQLRIVKRGTLPDGRTRWLATHWDKRDDDLLPFGGPAPLFSNTEQEQNYFSPVEVTLASGDRRARLKLASYRYLERPPSVKRVALSWSGDERDVAVLRFGSDEEGGVADVWRIRIAALVPGKPGEVVHVLDVSGSAIRPASNGQRAFSWKPTRDEARVLAKYCTSDGAAEFGTSIWFEDIVGHTVTAEDEPVWPDELAAFVSWDGVPTRMDAGARAKVTVTMRNVGPTAWTASSRIMLRNVEEVWEPKTVRLNQRVPVGGLARFSFTLAAPARRGHFACGWQLTRAGRMFGGTTPTVDISVGEDASCPSRRRKIAKIRKQVETITKRLAALDQSDPDNFETLRELRNDLREARADLKATLAAADQIGCAP